MQPWNTGKTKPCANTKPTFWICWKRPVILNHQKTYPWCVWPVGPTGYSWWGLWLFRYSPKWFHGTGSSINSTVYKWKETNIGGAHGFHWPPWLWEEGCWHSLNCGHAMHESVKDANQVWKYLLGDNELGRLHLPKAERVFHPKKKKKKHGHLKKRWTEVGNHHEVRFSGT